MSSFNTFKKQVSDQFKRMLTLGTVFNTEYNRDAIWQAYLNSFSDPVVRQEHNCNLCKTFIRQIGGAAVIDADLNFVTIWDFDDAHPDYHATVLALRAFVHDCKIKGLYYSDVKKIGCDKNVDSKTGTVWEHLYTELPVNLVGDKAAESGQFMASVEVFNRALSEISIDTVDTVKELIAQNSLYRGNEYDHLLTHLRNALVAVKSLSADKRYAYCLSQVSKIPENAARIRNTAIGTLLIDIQSSVDLDDAVKSYERITAPANYKRPTALVTPRMVEEAKKKLESLGLISALNRRRLDTRDLKASNALYTFRPKQNVGDVFASLTSETPVDTKTLSKVDEVSISDFVEKILPSADRVRVLFEHEHLGNLATLTGPVDADAKNLFKWDNSFGWSYTGGVADSIKEKVRKAGGKVDGVWLRASLAWSNYDDLDLHLKGRGIYDHCYFGNKRCSALNAHLDVDMNAGGGTTREPVENIYVSAPLADGSYTISVNQFSRRETNGDGFDLEIEVNGETHRFSRPKNPQGSDDVKFSVKDGRVTFSDNSMQKTSTGSVKWGLKTGIWHSVTAVTVSPNHWTTPIGNKHWFFIIPGTLSDEQTRPFYNEFLCQELAKERKVTEALSGKINVLPAEGAELSGLGFSETLRNHLYVEVESKMKRVIRVNF